MIKLKEEIKVMNCNDLTQITLILKVMRKREGRHRLEDQI